MANLFQLLVIVSLLEINHHLGVVIIPLGKGLGIQPKGRVEGRVHQEGRLANFFESKNVSRLRFHLFQRLLESIARVLAFGPLQSHR